MVNRADCHVHIDRIGGPHRTQPPTIAAFQEYAIGEQIDLAFVIYETESILEQFVTVPGMKLLPMYWERNPLQPNIPKSACAVKLHPYIENYPLTGESVGPTLTVARQRNLLVFVHLDDRKPELSRGFMMFKLAENYPDLTFVMAHAGSYAPPHPINEGGSTVDRDLICHLVSEAVGTVQCLNNVYLETSILASKAKSHIIIGAPVERILIGSDFPILAGSKYASVNFSEQRLSSGLTPTQIGIIHKNAFGLWERFRR